jgi:hypothetical protein
MASTMPAHTSQAVKIKGTILDFNTARKTVEIRTDKGKLLKCSYDPNIEGQITNALNFIVEAAGYLNVAENGQGKKIRRVVIKHIEIEDLDFESLGLKRRSLKELLESEIIGMWKDRADLEDVDEFMRKLRD